MPLKKITPATDQSRRKFIKNAGVAAAAFTIVPRFVLGGAGFKAPSDLLYVAGIGAGGKGEVTSLTLQKVERRRLLICATWMIAGLLNP